MQYKLYISFQCSVSCNQFAVQISQQCLIRFNREKQSRRAAERLDVASTRILPKGYQFGDELSLASSPSQRRIHALGLFACFDREEKAIVSQSEAPSEYA